MFGYCQTLLTHMDFFHAWGTNEVAVQVGSIVYSFNLGGATTTKKNMGKMRGCIKLMLCWIHNNVLNHSAACYDSISINYCQYDIQQIRFLKIIHM